MAFFESQSKLWDAMMNSMQKVRENGVPINKGSMISGIIDNERLLQESMQDNLSHPKKSNIAKNAVKIQKDKDDLKSDFLRT